MSSLFKIKVCGMRDAENITELVKLKPDYIGFIFYPKSKRFVADQNAQIITRLIPPEIKKVGVFVNEIASEIVRKLNLFRLDFVQLHGNESPAYCGELSSIGIKVIKAFGIDEHFNFNILSEYENVCEYFLFDTKTPSYGGSGIQFDWLKLDEYKFNKPVFLSGGIGTGDLEQILKLTNVPIETIDVNSKFETEPALKNINLLRGFINSLRN